MADNIRIGRISSIDYTNGMVEVVYADKDDAVTDRLPYLAMNHEYQMPNVDDMVLVLHLSNGSAMGIVLGTFWSKNNRPQESGKGIYRKELAQTPGEAYMRYSNGKLTIKANEVEIQTLFGTFTFNQGV